MKKLAFLFLIYDKINHEELWKTFFQNIDKNKYSIYIHYKDNKPLKYFQEYKLNYCIPTEYARISQLKAFNVLIEAALKDNDNTNFIFISGACIPLKSFDYVYDNIHNEYSYFNIADHSACFPRCNYALNFINEKYIQKSSCWIIFNRKHADLMVTKTDYLLWFENCVSPDEHGHITNIFYHNLENEIITTPNIADGATTFINWQGMNYKYPSKYCLKNYDYITKEELLYLMQSKSFFGRKFNEECISLYIPEFLNFISANSKYNKLMVDQIYKK